MTLHTVTHNCKMLLCLPKRTARHGGALLLAALTMHSGMALGAGEVDALVTLAFRNSPVIRSAVERLRQADAARSGSDAFLDAETRAAAGRTWGATAPPLLSGPSGLPPADAFGASAAVEVPVQPGLYAGIGAAEQYLLSPADSVDHAYRTVVGAQARIPLLQDRGFNLWQQDRTRLTDLRRAAQAGVVEARQVVRHAVEQAYIAYLEGVANRATAQAATERSQQLLQEAEELVRLQMVPEYQLGPARLELALRHQEDQAAGQALDASRVRLTQVLGCAAPGDLTTNAWEVVGRAGRAELPLEPALGRAVAARGDACALEALSAAAVAETRALIDRARPDLAFTVRGTWMSEDGTASSDASGVDLGDTTSAAALLVWTQPWHQTGARARIREAQAREAELTELRRDVANRLAAELATAFRDVAGSRAQLEQIATAVEQARDTLQAEAERFRLGEGRSRNVLDAQNDLTKAYRTRTAIAASLLRRHSDFLYAAGYNADDCRMAGVTALGEDDVGHQ